MSNDDSDRAGQLRSKYNVTVEPNRRLVLRVTWDADGHASKSTEERDEIAANALLRHAEQFVKEWNQGFDTTNVKFGGVEYIGTEGGWSKTEAPPGQPRK